jgi:hypothetical protein
VYNGLYMPERGERRIKRSSVFGVLGPAPLIGLLVGVFAGGLAAMENLKKEAIQEARLEFERFCADLTPGGQDFHGCSRGQ